MTYEEWRKAQTGFLAAHLLMLSEDTNGRSDTLLKVAFDAGLKEGKRRATHSEVPSK